MKNPLYHFILESNGKVHLDFYCIIVKHSEKSGTIRDSNQALGVHNAHYV